MSLLRKSDPFLSFLLGSKLSSKVSLLVPMLHRRRRSIVPSRLHDHFQTSPGSSLDRAPTLHMGMAVIHMALLALPFAIDFASRFGMSLLLIAPFSHQSCTIVDQSRLVHDSNLRFSSLSRLDSSSID